MQRRDAIENIIKNIDDELVICNIGFPSRELYDIKDRDENFYMIGSMGLVSSIALGLAISKPDKKIVIIDGDGAFLMNLGSIATIFSQHPDNLVWIVINNEAYGSTGNQETYAKNLDLKEIAKGVGFENSYNLEDIDFKDVLNKNELTFINYNVKAGNSKAPIIPFTPIQIKNRFMDVIK
ncbi:MAG: sulfopyruvate decarboxylase subunit beta [archaeon]|nr:sulfopyruvate decarboxylase subunit beta [archaeon]